MNSSDDRPSMELTKTDRAALLRLLRQGAEIIDRRAGKPKEADVARRMRLMIKKLIKKT